jgi:N-acyl-D-amino-acid deacylase
MMMLMCYQYNREKEYRMFDLILKNGLVADGTGRKAFRADVAVRDGRIAAVGADLGTEAGEVLDCTGLVVAPGFIDAHSHTDCSILEGRDGYSKLEQGITTEITGQCGESAAPSFEGSLDDARLHTAPERFREIERACDSFGAFLDAVEKQPIGPNMAFCVGQGNIRGRVMGYSDKTPDRKQLDAMLRLTAEAMEAGCLGFTTGLVYTPSVYAGTAELVEMAKVVHRYGGIYESHIRGEGDQLLDSVAEALAIGRASGIPVTVSHLKVIGRKNVGNAPKVLALLEKANEEGVRARADQYPYIAGSASLISQLPPRFMTDGRKALLARMSDKAVRDAMEKAIFEEYAVFESSIYSAGWEGCLIAEAEDTPEAVGKTLTELAEMWHVSPMDACCLLLTRNRSGVQGIYFSQNEQDMTTILSHPLVCAGSDWSAYAAHVDPEQKAGGHPRGTATMVHRLELLRDKKLMSMEEAVHSITGRAADTVGLPGCIGLLAEGRAADLCVFDWAGLRAHADFLHPFRRNEGLKYVLVNGTVAVRGGLFTGAQTGRVLRKGSR